MNTPIPPPKLESVVKIMKQAMSLVMAIWISSLAISRVAGRELLAGVARVEITDRASGPVNDPSFVKVLVLKQAATTAVLITVDAVAIGEIGPIPSDYLAKVRKQLQTELGIVPASVIVNASHCHSRPRLDADALTIQAAKEAWKNLVPVTVGLAVANEDRISENRRLNLKDGSQADMRRAYALPTDDDIASVGPIDSRVGILRLDRQDGRPFAVVYHFACHPIMNPPYKGNSADFPGFASKAIEEATGAMAFFVQGCGGDINPVRYKEANRPPDAEPLGNMLGLTVVRALKDAATKDVVLNVRNEVITVPLATDFEKRIKAIEDERGKLVDSLRPTNINFKSFLPLFIQQRVSPDFPSHNAQSYLQERQLGRDAIEKLDTENRQAVEAYLQNIASMEQLTRLNTNLALLKKHLAEKQASGKTTIDVEVCGLRIGEFKLVTFPGEVTVQVGLSIQQAADDPHLFVSGYTNGYIYYTPTAQQRNNIGYAQEDCDSIVAPEWQRVFEQKALDVLKKLD